MSIFAFLLTALAILLFIPIAILFMQLFMACLQSRNYKSLAIDYTKKRPSIAIVVPAHNEAGVIEKTLSSLLPQLTTKDKVIVIADNCSDNTAEIAKNMGANAIERFSETHRGKGYALDFAIQNLKQQPPEIIIIVDADCVVSTNLVDVLARKCQLLQKPIQAKYDMEFMSKGSLKKQLTAFSWLIKNYVRPIGNRAFNFPCQLMGTGMAFLWADISRCQLASGHLVEDMKLGLDLAQINKAPVFCEEAKVVSYFPESEEGITTQRTRWEHGHLGIIMHEAPALIWRAIQSKNLDMFMMTLDIIVPPIALLFILTVSMFITSLLFFIWSGLQSAFLVNAINVFLLGLGIFLAWLKYGQSIISLKSVLLAPLILLSKLPIYIGFIFNRQVEWVKSQRDSK